MPGRYSHDASGQRVAQYAEKVAPLAPQVSDYTESGFRHFRSTLQAGQSADNYYRVESWGPPVRPYGEWQFPYRPYAVPYDQWGPQPGPFGPTFPSTGFPMTPMPWNPGMPAPQQPQGLLQRLFGHGDGSTATPAPNAWSPAAGGWGPWQPPAPPPSPDGYHADAP
jgi:hypothetical protein